jgi:uncharacterized membrane protein YedE/YeeE
MGSGCTCSQAFRHGIGERLISAIFCGIFSFTLVPTGWNRGIGRGLADRLKLLGPAAGLHRFQEQQVARPIS